MRKNNKKSIKIHVNRGDTVKIISGQCKGSIGKVNYIISKNSKIVINDINKATKHIKPKQEGEQGQIIFIEKPIHSSNVILYKNK
uniref:Large ribosomal subunit protein uL24c n=1 Tax=Pterocladia lucida TaxID=31408 RepID=A0A6M3WW72_PTELU|nr:ribosomal protein L24 [Pterocladia lucida]